MVVGWDAVDGVWHVGPKSEKRAASFAFYLLRVVVWGFVAGEALCTVQLLVALHWGILVGTLQSGTRLPRDGTYDMRAFCVKLGGAMTIMMR